MNDDSYGSAFRDKMKQSMEQPTGYRPLNVCKPSRWARLCNWMEYNDEWIDLACVFIGWCAVFCFLAWVGHYAWMHFHG